MLDTGYDGEQLLARTTVTFNAQQNTMLQSAGVRIITTAFELHSPNQNLGNGETTMLTIKVLDNNDYTLCEVPLPSSLFDENKAFRVPVGTDAAKRIAGTNATFYAVSDAWGFGTPGTVVVDHFGYIIE